MSCVYESNCCIIYLPEDRRTRVQKINGPLTKHSFVSLRRRLASAGFRGDFVRQAILPDWWDDTCEQDPGLLPDIEVRVARFLGLPLAVVRDPSEPLSLPPASAKLRRVRDIETGRLTSAIHAAIQVAGAVARCMGRNGTRPSGIPNDGLLWRAQIKRDAERVSLEDILGDLWARGIPVIPLEILPTPSFQGLACIVQDRPAILLGHKYDEPGRIAFVVAHEVGHISSGDCEPNQPVVDEAEEGMNPNGAHMEQFADRYATSVLVGECPVPTVRGHNHRVLAQRAFEMEGEYGVDAGMIIYAWASRTRDYAQATMAIKALYRGTGARRQLHGHFARNVDIEEASETDRALLRCVYREPDRNAALS